MKKITKLSIVVPCFNEEEVISKTYSVIKEIFGASNFILELIFIDDGKPMQFFSFVSMLFFLTSVIVFIPIAQTFIETGLVPRLPSVLLSTGLMILSFLSITTGIILDSFSKSKLENKILAYLCYPKYKISEK